MDKKYIVHWVDERTEKQGQHPPRTMAEVRAIVTMAKRAYPDTRFNIIEVTNIKDGE